MIDNHKALIEFKFHNNTIIENYLFGDWKIQLAMQMTYFFFLDTGEIRTTDSKDDNVEIMKGNEADDIIKELSESFKRGYQNGLEKNKGSQFVFESVDLLSYSLHKKTLNRV